MGEVTGGMSVNTSRSISDGKTCGFLTTGNTLPEVEFRLDPPLCVIAGFVADEVGVAGFVHGSRHGNGGDEGGITQTRPGANAYETDRTIFDAIWRTIMTDQDFEGTKESWRAPPSFGLLYNKRGISAAKRLERAHVVGGQ